MSSLPSLLGAWRLCDQKKELERKAVEALRGPYEPPYLHHRTEDTREQDVEFAKAEHDRAIELLMVELKSWMQEP